MRPLYAFPEGRALTAEERRTLEAIRRQASARPSESRARATRTLLELERIRRAGAEEGRYATAGFFSDLEAALRTADALLELGGLRRMAAAAKILIAAKDVGGGAPARVRPASLLWHLLAAKASLFLSLPRTALFLLEEALQSAASSALAADGEKLSESLAGIPLLAAALASRFGRKELALNALAEAEALLPDVLSEPTPKSAEGASSDGAAASPAAKDLAALRQRWIEFQFGVDTAAPIEALMNLALAIERGPEPPPTGEALARRVRALASIEADPEALAEIEGRFALSDWQPSRPLGPLFCRARTCAFGFPGEVVFEMNRAAVSHLPVRALEALAKRLPKTLAALEIPIERAAALHIRQDFIVGIELEKTVTTGKTGNADEAPAASESAAPGIRWLDFRSLAKPGAALQADGGASSGDPSKAEADAGSDGDADNRLGLLPPNATEADILKHAAVLHYQRRYRSIIALLESLPAEKLTPAVLGELARAYNNAAKRGDDALYLRAIELLQTALEEDPDEAERYLWNYRMGYALCRLDRDGEALEFFERALEARPLDRDASAMAEACRRGLAMPLFERSFPERCAIAWGAFADASPALLALLAAGKAEQAEARIEVMLQNVGSDWIVEAKPAAPAADDRDDKDGSSDPRPVLVLSPDGRRSQIFPLLYFAKRMPEGLKRAWRLELGLPREAKVERAGAVHPAELSLWMTPNEDGWKAVFYAESLRALSPEEAAPLFPSLSELLSRTIGEAAAMRWIRGISIVKHPVLEPAMKLADLPAWLAEKAPGFEKLSLEELARIRIDYWLKPSSSPNPDLRFDAGSAWTLCPGLVNGYRSATTDDTDLLQRQGAFAGFFALEPVAALEGEADYEEKKQLLQALEEALASVMPNAAQLFGEAFGTRFGYADYFFWELHPALKAVMAWAEKESGVKSLRFHSFRRQAGTVILKEPAEEDPADDLRATVRAMAAATGGESSEHA